MPKKKLSAESILDKYSLYLLENNQRPANVFQFAKHIGVKEKEFYSFFSDFEAIEKFGFESMFVQTLSVLHKDPEYANYDAQTQLLSFYFTYFELLTANRSYVKMVLDGGTHLEKLKVLSSLRKPFESFVSTLDIQDLKIDLKQLQEFQSKGKFEILWHHYLCVFHFWLNDTSSNFEKTDIFIEKSVQTGFQIVNTAPLDSIIDLGKFLMSEFKK